MRTLNFEDDREKVFLASAFQTFFCDLPRLRVERTWREISRPASHARQNIAIFSDVKVSSQFSSDRRIRESARVRFFRRRAGRSMKRRHAECVDEDDNLWKHACCIEIEILKFSRDSKGGRRSGEDFHTSKYRDFVRGAGLVLEMPVQK